MSRLLILIIGLLSAPSLWAQIDYYQDKVVVITIGEQDLLNAQSFKFWKRTLKRVEQERAKAVILELNTPGGLAIPTKDLMMNALRNLTVPTYAYVRSEAISAGALLSIACDEIWMTPGSTIGAAAIVSAIGIEIENTMRAKLESFFHATIRSITQDKGHPTEIAQMMMFIDDKQRTYGPITLPPGELLTLTAEEAVQLHLNKPILAKGLAKSRSELLSKIGLLSTPVIVVEPTGFERIAWIITSISPLLIIIGIGAAIFEIKTLGFGVSGSVSLLAFGLFFFGNYIAGNLAGTELFLLFSLGILFIIIDIFLFPNLILGTIGAGISIATLLFAMVDRDTLEELGSPNPITGEMSTWGDLLITPIFSLAIGLIGGLILILILMRSIQHLPVSSLTLNRSLASPPSSSIPLEKNAKSNLIGATGIALIDFHPSGKVRINGTSYDAITQGEFLEKGDPIIVIPSPSLSLTVSKSS